MNFVLQDLRTAVRTFAQNPGIGVLAIACLATGIAANTTIFSLADTFWLRSLPIADPRAVVNVFTSAEGQAGRVSYPDYEDFRQRTRTLADLAASARFRPSLSAQEGPAELATTEVVTPNYFSVIGVKAAQGRLFTSADEASNEPVAVLSHKVWQQRFGGGSSIVGRQVTIDRRAYTVIGVASRDFTGMDPSLSVDVWVPFGSWFATTESRRSLVNRGERMYDVVGRLRPGIGIDQARADLGDIAADLSKAYPDTNKKAAVQVDPAGGQPAYQPYLLLGLVGLVLLIACANVANLLLARSEARRREIAIRQALGAGRWRLAWQTLSEGIVLASASTVVALLVASWTIRALPALVVAPSTTPAAWLFVLDARAVGFTLACAVVTALACSTLPALAAMRVNLIASLGGQRAPDRALRPPVRNVLVVVQVALAVVTLACAGLLVRTFVAGLSVDLGFERKDMLLARVETPYEPAEARRFFTQLLDRLRSNPHVRFATSALRPPMWPSEGGRTITVAVSGWVGPAGQRDLQIKEGVVDAQYFQVLGTRVLEGRVFDRQDDQTGLKVAVVNRTMAQRFWPNASAVGQVIRVGRANPQDRKIVGVVEDTRINRVNEPAEAYLYLPFLQTGATFQNIMLQASDGNAASLAPLLRSEIARLDRHVVIYEMWTMRELLRSQFFDREMPATVAGSIALLGLMLAVAGLYGVVSYTVARRTHEMGIRIALGADRPAMLGLVLRQGLRLAAVGVACGIVASTAVTPLLARWLQGVNPRDPLTLALVAILMTLVALAAAYFPARRATRVDPIVALRYE